ncbi:MAG: hypothetical protein KDH96_13415, partial [Candidatus Riesia sp.]|nr:hypothetical protein [Candidatus Riesia sp.]
MRLYRREKTDFLFEEAALKSQRLRNFKNEALNQETTKFSEFCFQTTSLATNLITLFLISRVFFFNIGN